MKNWRKWDTDQVAVVIAVVLVIFFTLIWLFTEPGTGK